MTKSYLFHAKKCDIKVILMSYDKHNLTFVGLYNLIIKLVAEKEIKCSASLAFYHFSPTCSIHSIIQEQSCKMLYVTLVLQGYFMETFGYSSVHVFVYLLYISNRSPVLKLFSFLQPKDSMKVRNLVLDEGKCSKM